MNIEDEFKREEMFAQHCVVRGGDLIHTILSRKHDGMLDPKDSLEIINTYGMRLYNLYVLLHSHNLKTDGYKVAELLYEQNQGRKSCHSIIGHE